MSKREDVDEKNDKPSLKTFRLEKIPLSSIKEIKGFNPRSSLGNLDQLKSSIRKYGIIEPLVVRLMPSGKAYQLICGHRRKAACVELNVQEVPAIIKEIVDDMDALAINMAENSQDVRTQLDPLDEARVFQKFKDQGLTYGKIANLCGFSAQKVMKSLQLLGVAEPVKKMLERKFIPKTAAIAFAEMSPTVQEKILPQMRQRITELVGDKQLTEHEVRTMANDAVRSDASLGRATERVGHTKKGIPKDTTSVWRQRRDINETIEQLVVDIENEFDQNGDNPKFHEKRGALAALLWSAGRVVDFSTSTKEYKRRYNEILETKVIEVEEA